MTFAPAASLALWLRRYHYRNVKATQYLHALRHAKTAADQAAARAQLARWEALMSAAQSMVHRRETQIAAQKPARIMEWMPGAIHMPRAGSGTHASGYAPKGLLHTTDGMSDATGTLDGNRDWPNFEVIRDGRIIQYFPVNASSRALVHNGYPETNNGGPCQIEIVSLEPMTLTPSQRTSLKRLMRFIEANHGVQRASHVRWGHDGAYRLRAGVWVGLHGWCGHEHVPENDHTDPSGPGTIAISDLLS